MNDQQSTSPPPAGELPQPVPIFRRHWDGNGWTQPTPTASNPQQVADPRLGRTAS